MAARLGVVSKTFSLLLEPLRHVSNPGFVATIFRRTSTQVRNPGGLWTESRNLYSQFGASNPGNRYRDHNVQSDIADLMFGGGTI